MAQGREMQECCEGMTDAMEMCPMASMCKGIIRKPMSRFLLMILGAILVLGGVVILLEPKFLFWLMACTSILIGITILVFASFIHKLGAPFRNMPG